MSDLEPSFEEMISNIIADRVKSEPSLSFGNFTKKLYLLGGEVCGDLMVTIFHNSGISSTFCLNRDDWRGGDFYKNVALVVDEEVVNLLRKADHEGKLWAEYYFG